MRSRVASLAIRRAFIYSTAENGLGKVIFESAHVRTEGEMGRTSMARALWASRERWEGVSE